MKARLVRFVILGSIFLFVLFCPYKSTTAPAWRVEVVDQSGSPISGIEIRQAWQYYDADIAPQESGWRATDTQGRADFPRRVSWLSLASRAMMGSTSSERIGPSFFIQACDEQHLLEAKFFWDGNKYWNPSVHPGVTKLVATSVEECGEID